MRADEAPMWNTVSAPSLAAFSFHSTPVLVVENFWSQAECALFREEISQVAWQSLADLPKVKGDFPNAGNWAKAEIGGASREQLLARFSLLCLQRYMESFLNITGRRVGLNYYSYAAGDCSRERCV